MPWVSQCGRAALARPDIYQRTFLRRHLAAQDAPHTAAGPAPAPLVKTAAPPPTPLSPWRRVPRPQPHTRPPPLERAGLATLEGPATGCPVLEASNAYVECSVVTRMEAGDHYLLYAQVGRGTALHCTALHCACLRCAVLRAAAAARLGTIMA